MVIQPVPISAGFARQTGSEVIKLSLMPIIALVCCALAPVDDAARTPLGCAPAHSIALCVHPRSQYRRRDPAAAAAVAQLNPAFEGRLAVACRGFRQHGQEQEVIANARAHMARAMTSKRPSRMLAS